MARLAATFLRVILSNFLKQGGEGRDREWQREKKEDKSRRREVFVEEEREKCNKIIISHFATVVRTVSYLRQYCSNVA